MAKLTCFLVLVVVVLVCAEAIRIDPVQPASSRRGKYFPEITRNDPRCKNGTGMFPDPKDCTKYIKCVNGDSQEKKCPEDFKYDSIRHCIPPDDNPDCGRKTLRSHLDVDEKCPESYGIFPVKSDCHKFMVCNDGIPIIKTCPEKYVYRDANGACIEGDKCPDEASEESVCKRANQLLPDGLNCRRYIKCVNFQPLKKECPPGTAFDPKKHRCTKDQLEQCKNNDILNNVE
ncbi:protein obstructor-E-like [Argiope bruennichi]|uniref:protein obstructor-E-like n=1 Tax=Argiope bruennichi TaxID=94029 RepID=UPI00249454B7|nr:protein obstructor-E-like [Argiope bruennichi]